MNTITASDGLIALLVENHTREKLHYLERYIYQFATATKDKWATRNFIDLFSGPGVNAVEGKGDEIDGSPLLAIKTRYPFQTYHFCDMESGFLDVLTKRVQKASLDESKTYYYTGDSNKQVEQVLKRLQPTKSINLVVVDPPGANCHWETIRKLSKLKYVDFVINFPLGMAIKRILHQSYQAEEDSALDLFFGTQEWRDIYERAAGQSQMVTRPLINLYKRKLAELGYLEAGNIFEKTNYLSSYSSSIEIRRDEGQKLYFLILASRNKLAHRLWSQATKVDDEGQERLL